MSELAPERDSDSLRLALPATEEEWEVLAERHMDGLDAFLHTLGGEVLSTTAAVVMVEHKNGVVIHKQGTLGEVAPVYTHPMLHVSHEEAQIAYPSRAA